MIPAPLQKRIEAARAARERLAAFRTNRPDIVPERLPPLLHLAEAILAEVTGEITRDLSSLQSSLQDVELLEEPSGEYERFEHLFLGFKNAIEQARLAAMRAGYASDPEDGQLPPVGLVPRLRIERELAALGQTVGDLREELAELRRRAAQEPDQVEQSALIAVAAERIDIKLSLIEVKVGQLVDIPGLTEAARAALRLTQAFVATVRSAYARVSGWLKERAQKTLLPAAERMAGRLTDLLAKASQDVAPVPREADTPPMNIVAAIAMIQRGEMPPKAVQPYLTVLEIEGDEALAVAARLPNLQRLTMRWVSDVSPLAEATSLRSLDLEYSSISDVSGLSGLTALTNLSLNDTKVSDVSALSGLTALTSLSLSGIPVSDVSALSSLTSLTSFSLTGTQVSDVSALSGLTTLTSLFLSRTQVSDVSALSGLTALTSLSLGGTQVSDVSALSGLTTLTSLFLNHTKVADVSALSGLMALTELYLNGTHVSDVSALSGLTALTNLYLRGTPVSDVSALSGLTALTSLDLAETRVSNVSALSGLTALTSLYLHDTPVSDVSALSDLPIEVGVEGEKRGKKLASRSGGLFKAFESQFSGWVLRPTRPLDPPP